eukprot:Lithocolla_globosa_v1_NODE_4506_length_1420_cov_231.111355.p1 type:complete len:393 gc:universal NODE_4506_length_1420_cov_231.111355:109-1287(+)
MVMWCFFVLFAFSRSQDCTYESDVDYWGNDLSARYSVPNKYDCCGICLGTAGCNAFTWTNYEGGTCWLKSHVDSSRPFNGAFSGQLNFDDPEDSSSFFMLGDWGAKGAMDSSLQERIAQMMIGRGRQKKPALVFGLGDNIYWNGLDASDPEGQITNTWVDVYKVNEEPLNVPWYFVLGNHDFGAESTWERAQERAERQMHVSHPLWRMESYYYHVHHPASNSLFVLLDLNINWYRGNANSGRVCGNMYGEEFDKCEQGLQKLYQDGRIYLENQVASYRQNYPGVVTVVLTHYPLWSIYDSDASFLTLMEQLEIDYYFGGHTHVQYEENHSGKPRMFCSGGGGYAHPDGPTQGFYEVQVTNTSSTVISHVLNKNATVTEEMFQEIVAHIKATH